MNQSEAQELVQDLLNDGLTPEQLSENLTAAMSSVAEVTRIAESLPAVRPREWKESPAAMLSDLRGLQRAFSELTDFEPEVGLVFTCGPLHRILWADVARRFADAIRVIDTAPLDLASIETAAQLVDPSSEGQRLEDCEDARGLLDRAVRVMELHCELHGDAEPEIPTGYASSIIDELEVDTKAMTIKRRGNACHVENEEQWELFMAIYRAGGEITRGHAKRLFRGKHERKNVVRVNDSLSAINLKIYHWKLTEAPS